LDFIKQIRQWALAANLIDGELAYEQQQIDENFFDLDPIIIGRQRILVALCGCSGSLEDWDPRDESSAETQAISSSIWLRNAPTASPGLCRPD
jgi:hypothetical protein